MDVAEKRKGAFWGVVLLLGVVCTLLVVTGRLHILGAIFAALVPLFLPWVAGLPALDAVAACSR